MCTSAANKFNRFILQYAYLMIVALYAISSTFVGNFRYFSILFKIVSYCVFIINVYVLISRHVERRWLAISLFLLINGVVVAYFNMRQIQTAILIIFIINGRLLNMEKLLSKYVVVTTIILISTVLLAILGIVYNDSRERSVSGVIRYYLGFSAATYAPNYLFHVVLAYFAAKTNKVTFIETLIIIIANYLLYYWTNTKAVYYLIILLLLLLWFDRVYDFRLRSKFLKFIITILMPVCAIAIFYLSYRYSPSDPFTTKIDAFLTGRLRLAKTALTSYGLNLFGHNIIWITGRAGIERTEEYFYVDSSYINATLTFGLVFLVFVVVSFSKMMRTAYEQKRKYLLIALIFLTIHSISDPQLLDLKYDPFLLFLLPRSNNSSIKLSKLIVKK